MKPFQSNVFLCKVALSLHGDRAMTETTVLSWRFGSFDRLLTCKYKTLSSTLTAPLMGHGGKDRCPEACNLSTKELKAGHTYNTNSTGDAQDHVLHTHTMPKQRQ